MAQATVVAAGVAQEGGVVVDELPVDVGEDAEAEDGLGGLVDLEQVGVAAQGGGGQEDVVPFRGKGKRVRFNYTPAIAVRSMILFPA